METNAAAILSQSMVNRQHPGVIECLHNLSWYRKALYSMFSDQEQTVLDMPSLARIATLMPDGSPQLTVMWFRPEGDTLRMVTPAAAKKVANLEHDGRVAVVVEEPGNPYNFVEVRGTVEVVRDDAAARAELVKIATRYIGDRAAGYAGSLSSDPRVILVIHAGKIVSHPGKGPAAASTDDD